MTFRQWLRNEIKRDPLFEPDYVWMLVGQVMRPAKFPEKRIIPVDETHRRLLIRMQNANELEKIRRRNLGRR